MKWFVWPQHLVEPQDIEGYSKQTRRGSWPAFALASGFPIWTILRLFSIVTAARIVEKLKRHWTWQCYNWKISA